MFKKAFITRINYTTYIRNSQRSFCDIGCKNNSRAFRRSENFFLYFIGLTAIKFKSFNCFSKRFFNGFFCFFYLDFSRKKNKSGFPDTIYLQSSKRLTNRVFNRFFLCRRLMNNLNRVERNTRF